MGLLLRAGEDLSCGLSHLPGPTSPFTRPLGCCSTGPFIAPLVGLAELDGVQSLPQALLAAQAGAPGPAWEAATGPRVEGTTPGVLPSGCHSGVRIAQHFLLPLLDSRHRSREVPPTFFRGQCVFIGHGLLQHLSRPGGRSDAQALSLPSSQLIKQVEVRPTPPPSPCLALF